jgi:hypothetical protein
MGLQIRSSEPLWHDDRGTEDEVAAAEGLGNVVPIPRAKAPGPGDADAEGKHG